MTGNRALNYLINTCFIGFSNFTYFFFPLFLLRLGMSGVEIGALLMTYTVTALLTSFIVGFFEDRFGARGNTVFGLALMALFYFGVIRSVRFPALLFLFFLGGLGNNVIRVTMNALFLKSHDSRRQGREIGRYNFLSQFFMGCGIVLGALLLARLRFRAVFIISGALSLFLIGFAARLRPEHISVTPLSRYVRDLATKRVALFAAALVLFYLHWGAEIACYSPFLKTVLGLSTVQSGIFMGLPIVFLAVCTYYFGVRRDRGESSIRLALVAILFSGTGLILFAVSPGAVSSFVFRLVHEIGDAAFVIFTYVGMARLFPRERMGGSSGSMFLVMIAAQSAGSLIFSWMAGAHGYVLPYIVAGGCSLAAIPLILLARAHYRFE